MRTSVKETLFIDVKVHAIQFEFKWGLLLANSDFMLLNERKF